MFIEYTSNKDIELMLYKSVKLGKEPIIHYMETKKLEDNKYRAKINISIAEGREILLPGKWYIFPKNENDKVEASSDILLNIEDYSRIFRYSSKEEAYTATFHIEENVLNIDAEANEDDNDIIDDKDLRKADNQIYIYTNYMIVNYHPEKKRIRDVLKRRVRVISKMRTIGILTAKWILNTYYQIVTHITPKTGKRILFMSQNMDHIRDNMVSVNNRLKERGLDKKYKISYDFVNIFDGKLRVFYWLKITTKIAKQDFIFVDDYVPIFSFLKKNKKTVLTQLWHAGFGFKLVGYGRFGITGSPRPYESCHRQYTYGVIGNENLKEIYSEVWGIDKESLLPTGMPRLEHFLDKDYIDKVKTDFYEQYPQLKEKKIITFAPTYRGSSQFNAYYDYDKIDFKELYKYCKDNNYAVAFGKHHFILQDIPIPEECKDLIYDMHELKLNDLLYVTDILVTDYSSAFYDFLLLERPVLFYVYDKDIYSATRGVHRPIDKVAPGKICNDFDELMQALKNKDYGVKEKADFLIDNCIKNKKIASDQIIDYVILKKGVLDEKD